MSGAGRCTFCRAGVAAQARFCSACGTPVAPAGETASRRIVTVLFCDLVGSTAVAQAVDPEAVHAQAVPPLTLKGKSAPVPAYQFVSIDEAPGRAGGTALVGRAVELDHLRQVYRRVRRGRRCCLVTVVGSAGIGKSRLVQEFL